MIPEWHRKGQCRSIIFRVLQIAITWENVYLNWTISCLRMDYFIAPNASLEHVEYRLESRAIFVITQPTHYSQ